MVATAEGEDDLFSHIDDDLQLPEVGVLSVDQLPQGLLLVQSLASQRLCVCVCVCGGGGGGGVTLKLLLQP